MCDRNSLTLTISPLAFVELMQMLHVNFLSSYSLHLSFSLSHARIFSIDGMPHQYSWVWSLTNLTLLCSWRIVFFLFFVFFSFDTYKFLIICIAIQRKLDEIHFIVHFAIYFYN